MSDPRPPEFLTSVLGVSSSKPRVYGADPTRPYVTLTFAQSLDAKIAGRGGKQLILSGRESMVMTHWMRTMHDGILIGINTALNDDPQLNTRHLPARTGVEGHQYHLPRPIILDSRLRFSAGSKLLKNYREGRGRRPWILCTPPPHSTPIDGVQGDSEWTQRRDALQRAGASIIEVPAVNGLLSIRDILTTLSIKGIRGVMVEGGARVIGSFLSETGSASKKGFVDMIIVTTAPTLVGEDGVGYGLSVGEGKISALQHVRTETMGRDSVVALVATSKAESAET